MSKITEVNFEEQTETNKEEVLVLNNMVFIELDILSGKTSQKELKRYEEKMKAYYKETQRAENLGLNLNDIEEPEEPDMKIEYRKQWLNISNKEIDNWYSDWDTERDCEVVIFDYTFPGGIEQLNVRITKQKWMELLESLGAVHIKPE